MRARGSFPIDPDSLTARTYDLVIVGVPSLSRPRCRRYPANGMWTVCR